jgi:hypothetical protein
LLKGKLKTGPKDSPEDSASTPHHRHKFSQKENILYFACRNAKWDIKTIRNSLEAKILLLRPNPYNPSSDSSSKC